jgi:hypothetical protein
MISLFGVVGLLIVSLGEMPSLRHGRDGEYNYLAEPNISIRTPVYPRDAWVGMMCYSPI